MIQLQNEHLLIEIAEKGAELVKVFGRQTGLNYLWSGDVAWPKHSPILFPIVGALRDNTYRLNGKSYTLPRHGFAREKTFRAVDLTLSAATLVLQEDEQSLEVYPFTFELQIVYKLEANQLHVEYRVLNKNQSDMLFSIGGHPAFAVPLVTGLQYEDYYLEFGEKETAPRWPIIDGGLIGQTPLPFLEDQSRIDCTRELFAKDAIVFKDLQSKSISIKSEKSANGLTFHFPGFNFLGLWAAKGGDFVCIEPWCGIADQETHDQQFESKEGVERLEVAGEWRRSWMVEFF